MMILVPQDLKMTCFVCPENQGTHDLLTCEKAWSVTAMERLTLANRSRRCFFCLIDQCLKYSKAKCTYPKVGEHCSTGRRQTEATRITNEFLCHRYPWNEATLRKLMKIVTEVFTAKTFFSS